MDSSSPSNLTRFQTEVAQLFFALPESRGFLLAGAGALLAQGLTHRPTEDLDFFGDTGAASVQAARDALVEAAGARGWQATLVREFDTFCRLQITAAEDLVIDLAIDSPPLRPPTVTPAGPSFDPEELAARKMLALFGRAAPRDFSDIYELTRQFGKAPLLTGAAALDPGFHHGFLAQSIRSLAGIPDQQLPVAPEKIPALRKFFTEWANELTRDAPA